MRPLAVDLYAGLGGWSSGLLAEGYDCVGFDIERHEYGDHHYPAQLVLQDVLTLHGSQFKDAALIVASPPCQEYSYMAMPWKLAKAKAAAIRADETGQMLTDLNRLFDACFRIQGQASLAAGRHIPMVVENVRGAQPWVGRARWNFGSYYLWGDVPALMPDTRAFKVPGFRFDGSGGSFQSAAVREGVKAPGMNWSDPAKRGQDFTRIASQLAGIKGAGASWDADAGHSKRGVGHWTSPFENGTKCGGDWFNAEQPSISRLTSSKSPARKAASAMIAKIPLTLSRHIAAIYRP